MKTKFLAKIRTVLIIAFAFIGMNIAAQDVIKFTWLVIDYGHTEEGYKKYFSIKASKDEPFIINWGDGVVEAKSCESDIYAITPIHYYDAMGEYTVTITAVNTNCIFETFDNQLEQVISLDITGCLALTKLICYYNAIESLTICPSLVSVKCFTTLLKNLDLSNGEALLELYCNDNQLTSLDLNECPVLKRLECNYNQLTYLDLSECPNLEQLRCDNNKLKNLELNKYSSLEYLNCFNNQLQLSDLFSAHLLVDNLLNRRLGPQNLEAKTAIIGEELFSEQSVFNGIFTTYLITKGGTPAPESDYLINNGKLTFKTAGNYTVIMTNNAIISNENFPAEVIIPISVWPVGILEENISSINVYPNPTTGQLIVKSEQLKVDKITIFDSFGKEVLETKENISNINHLPEGLYIVKVYLENGEVVTRKVVKL